MNLTTPNVAAVYVVVAIALLVILGRTFSGEERAAMRSGKSDKGRV